MKKRLKKISYTILFVFILLFAGYLFREQLLKTAGNFLIAENPPEKAEVIFVLGGNSYDRAIAAAQLYQQGFGEKVVALGENVPTVFKAVGMELTESETCAGELLKRGVEKEDMVILKKGTSTQEEGEAIVEYCLKNGIEKALVISDKFHTRRIRLSFQHLFQENNIRLLIAGAPSSNYNEKEWWKSEGGLIMVNNEYIKLFYYWVKY